MKKIWLNLIILFFYVCEIIIGGEITPGHVLLILVFLSVDIVREKYLNNNISKILEIIIIIIIISKDIKGTLLLGIIILTTEDEENALVPIAAIILGLGVLYYSGCYDYIAVFSFYVVLCLVIGKQRKSIKYMNNLYNKTYDKERRYIYELERSKQELINNSNEIMYLTEVKERNRIARSLHDNLGHKIAGILIQLRACKVLALKDKEKALGLLDGSIEAMAESLDLIRETVHNIKPKENIGIEYIKALVGDFKYCDVEFIQEGDFNNLNSYEMQIILSTLKEALTNISKHSKASKVIIKIESNNNFIRLYIKDNGIGYVLIKEGLGISGMKERIVNIGGNLSISSEEGFIIVLVIPRKTK
ncbi:sensor histidine kinase [Clostridium algidicarnis]|uniref:sensor histidine kinase n=1 Tax=Clostridium algidicarnis TaxID=37659 RepID=UPI001C0CCEC9|nr:histidine kinase [Clostridium algidicarnis]MBU3209329.1 sensor histidine kinase [Clostridium algidicarnis]MBU3228041.1 sensor histidine kinase [Clostridium algidicarnis]MBU3251789.1 sensor histidine kinase [Clostridium algidicarnis]